MEDKKIDRRVAKTRMHMIQTTLELLRKNSFSKISVSDICEEAMISRSTFYTHFEDKFALLDACMEQIAQQLLHDLVVEQRNGQIGYRRQGVALHPAEHPGNQHAHHRAGKELADFCCLLGRDIRFQLPRILRKDGAEIIEHIVLQAVLSVVGQGVTVEHFVFQEIGFQCC